jgi:hypothetical protein
MVVGKLKGGSYERTVAKKLSLWLTNGKEEDCLWRSAMSGGRATVAHKKGIKNRQAGDLAAVSPEGHLLTNKYFVECKAYKDLEIMQFFIKGKGLLAGFWKTTVKQARIHNREPMLIAKQNNVPELVFIQDINAQWQITGIAYSDINNCCVLYLSDLLQADPKKVCDHWSNGD